MNDASHLPSSRSLLESSFASPVYTVLAVRNFSNVYRMVLWGSESGRALTTADARLRGEPRLMRSALVSMRSARRPTFASRQNECEHAHSMRRAGPVSRTRGKASSTAARTRAYFILGHRSAPKITKFPQEVWLRIYFGTNTRAPRKQELSKREREHHWWHSRHGRRDFALVCPSLELLRRL